MITQWTLANFKCVRKATTLELAPLTIFAGPNSSGKTTLLQSILLISQTLAHRVSSTPLLLNGPLARLGDFEDIKCADTDSTDITIGCVFATPSTIPPLTVSCEASFTPYSAARRRAPTAAPARLLSTSLVVTTTDRDGTARTSFVSLRRTRRRPPRAWWLPSDLPSLSNSHAHTEYEVQSVG